jgi:SAM-dependent methyltransferase
MDQSKTYADFGLSRSWRQISHALHDRQHADDNMQILLDMLKKHEERMERKLGRPLENLKILEIGPGQGKERARYFGIRNEVTGIDLDIIPDGFQPRQYWQMWRENGPGRLLKTMGRKLIIGRMNAAAWEKAVGRRNLPTPNLIHGDICQPLGDIGKFDVVMSWSVFEHLPDPERALQNIVHLLNPGGIFYLSLHLFTAHNGHHDIRAFTGQEMKLPLWGHLRPTQCHLVHPSSYLNEWRLADWRTLFNRITPGAEEFLESFDVVEKFGAQLNAEIREELNEYSDEELFTVDAIYLWKKDFD